jgi:hypothetical protein
MENTPKLQQFAKNIKKKLITNIIKCQAARLGFGSLVF